MRKIVIFLILIVAIVPTFASCRASRAPSYTRVEFSREDVIDIFYDNQVSLAYIVEWILSSEMQNCDISIDNRTGEPIYYKWYPDESRYILLAGTEYAYDEKLVDALKAVLIDGELGKVTVSNRAETVTFGANGVLRYVNSPFQDSQTYDENWIAGNWFAYEFYAE